MNKEAWDDINFTAYNCVCASVCMQSLDRYMSIWLTFTKLPLEAKGIAICHAKCYFMEPSKNSSYVRAKRNSQQI
jgi:hypothetical protein